ncbi:MAG: alpha/beta hydrolase [Proteobacteria bacterium]|nr:alpha/beta hydrolase [Pseudomonadota bacterium]
MTMKDRLDPELVAPLEFIEAATGGELDLSDIPAAREQTKQFAEIRKSLVPDIEEVASVASKIPRPEDAPDVSVLMFRPKNRPEPLPALLWIHGGGYVIGSAEQDDLNCKALARALDCVVVAVDYRLAPEHPFPAPIEDCYAALKWLSLYSEELDVDKSRIAIGGASAGGGLAAGLALLTRDRGEVAVVFQLLIYPMIDDCNVAPADEAQPDTFIWSRGNNLTGWRSYLGREPGGEDVSPYAAVFRATDLSGLPPAIISVGELDLFLNENIVYAQRLLEAGVPTELHVYSGAYHGFNSFAPDTAVSKRFNTEYLSVLKRALHA